MLLIIPRALVRSPAWLQEAANGEAYLHRLEELKELPDLQKARAEIDAIRTILASSYVKLRQFPQARQLLGIVEKDDNLREVMEAAAQERPEVTQAELERSRQLLSGMGRNEFVRMAGGMQRSAPRAALVALAILATPAIMLAWYEAGCCCGCLGFPSRPAMEHVHRAAAVCCAP
jgi:hypothetical protein